MDRRLALIGRLRDDDPTVRARAAESLDRLEVLASLPGLVSRLRDLTRIEWLELLRSLVGRRDETSLKLGLRCLDHPDAEVRVVALDLVDSFSDVRASSSVSRRLSDAEPIVRARAAEVLGRLGDRRRGDEIAVLLADPDPRVVSRAAEAVGLLDHTASEPRLLALLEHADPDVRASASEALGRIGITALD